MSRDTRECGFMGCGQPPCVDVCAGVARDATIRRVARPRGELTDEQLLFVRDLKAHAERAQAKYRRYCVILLSEGCSFTEVSKATGLSTNTLQRWKRGAND